MDFKKTISSILACSVLCGGCQSKVVRYTSEDALDYALQKANTTSAKLVGVIQKNDDTIWTFQESYDRGLTWQTIDHHYTNSTSNDEYNELISNYDVSVIRYYFDLYEAFEKDVLIDYTYIDSFPFDACLELSFETRDDLQQAYDEVKAFLSYVKKENANYTDTAQDFALQVDLKRNDAVFHYASDTSTFSDVEEQYLAYVIYYQDTEGLSQFSKEEIDTFTSALDSLIYYRNDEKDDWHASTFYAKDHDLKISSTALYDLLQQMKLKDIQIDGERENFTIRKDEETYGPYTSEMLSFYEVERITKLQLRCQWQLDEVNDEDAQKEMG